MKTGDRRGSAASLVTVRARVRVGVRGRVGVRVRVIGSGS